MSRAVTTATRRATADGETGVGRSTDAQHETLLLTGTKPDGEDAAPIMPTAAPECPALQ